MNNQERMDNALNGGMFPKPVDNIDEVIKKEECIDGENVSEEHIEMKVEPIKESDIFMKPTKSKVRLNIGEKNVKVKKQRDYSHLAKARAKGAVVRKAKAEARRIQKAEEKEEKNRLKAEKKEASAERNRQRAKDRYYANKKDVPSHQKPAVIQSPPVPKGMDFNTFANYMLKYENMKKKYKDAVDSQTAERERKMELKRREEAKKPVEKKYHPDNYPLAHIYNPNNRKNTSYF
jgi:hypothetical protein